MGIKLRSLALVTVLFCLAFNGWGQTPNGAIDFGNTAGGTTATTGNTGFGGIRIGAGGGTVTIQNTGQSIGTQAEIRGIAPTGTSVNSFGITSTEYGTAATTFTVSFELYLSGGASGTWSFFAGNGTSYGSAQSAAFTGSESFTGLHWIFGSSSAITTENRAGSTWTAVSGTPFSQGTAYYVTVVGNNSASTVNYGASNAYSVASGKYDLWVNGTLAGDDLGKALLASGTNINAFRFYGESSTSNVAQIALDNIRWYNTCTLPPTHLALVSVPTTGTVSTNLASYSVEARSGSASGPVANNFSGAITVAKASGPGNISGTLAPSALAGVASYANTQFDAAGTYTISASAAAPIVSSSASGNIVINAGGPNTITASAASFGPFCNNTGNNVTLSYTTSGTVTTPLTIELSNSSGSFASGTSMLTTTPGTGTVSASIPASQSAGSYRVRIVSNDATPVVSNDNGSNITVTAAQTPSVSINDPGAAICANQNYTFTPTPATIGGGTASYLWTINGTAGAASGNTYSSSLWSTGNTVRAVLTVSGGCVTSTTANSNIVTITATTPVTPAVSIASDAPSNTACAGTLVTFTPTPTSGGAPTYQWQINSGSTTSGSTFSSSALANGDQVKCTMTSSVSCVTSSTATATPITMTINSLPSAATGLTNQSVCGTGNVTFTVNDPGAGLTVEWSTNGTSNNDGIGAGGSGALTKTKSVTVGTPIPEYARISNGNGCKSAWVSATGTAVAAPSISANPADQSVPAGSTATFTVTASNAASYSWYESTDGGNTWGASPLTTTGIYNVATAGTLTVTPGSTSLNGYRYKVVVNGNSPCGTVTSTPSTGAIMTVTPGPCVSSNFDASTTLPGGWGGTSSNDAVNGHFSSSPNCRGLNASNSTLITPAADYPASVNFYLDGSSVQTLTLAYQVGSTSGSWTNITTWNSSTAGANISYTLTGTPTTSANVYFRFSSGGNTIYMDDIAIYCGAGAPDINAKGNSVSIPDGSTITSTTDFTQFASTAVGATSTRTFTIENAGGAGTINLTGTPKVAVSGSSAFTVTTQPSSSALTTGQSTTFVVTFTPANTTTQTATISIANDDPDAAEQTYTFNISGTGSYLATSTITESGTTYNGGTPATKIEYTGFQSTPAINQSITGTIQVLRFNINDLGGGDGQPTILSGLNFTVKDPSGTNQVSQIRHAVIAISNSIKAVATITGNELQFTGLNASDFTALDNSSLTCILRVSYKSSGITDNTKFVFKVSSATADVSGSVFAAADAGGATSDNNALATDNKNRINVTADRLAFVQGPSTVSVNTPMTPSVTVKASDVNGMVDVDYTGTVTIASTGTLDVSSTNSASLSSGVATFGNIVHNATATGRTLSATLSPLTGTGNSSTFDIITIVYVANDYRTATGTGLTWGDANDWQMYNGTTWGAFGANGTPSSTRNVFIQGEMTTGSITINDVTVLNGGVLSVTGSSTANGNVTIKTGGTIIAGAAASVGRFTFGGNAKTFEVEDGGYVYIQYKYGASGSGDPTTTLWNATEKFHPQSVFVVQEWNNTANDFFIATTTDVSTYTNPSTGYAACFGYLIIDMFNTASTSDFVLLPTGFNRNLTHRDLIYRSSGSNWKTRFCDGNFTTGVGGSVLIESAFAKSVSLLNASGTATLTVKGSLLHAGSNTFKLCATGNSGNTASVTLNIDSDIVLSSTGILDFNTTTNAGTGTVPVINLKGDITIASGALLTNTNAQQNGTINFIGTGDGLSAATTQEINIASTGSTRNAYINFKVNPTATGAYVQLKSHDLQLGTSSGVTVATGGTLDFNFSGTTALNITSYSTGSSFTSATLSTLKITSPQGCNNTSGTVGNVQTTIAPSYNQTATFWFLGKANQSTGTIFGVGGSADRNIYVKLVDNSTTLTPVVQTTIGAGGKVEVQKGIVINTAAVDFIGSTGKLIMTDGVYQNAETASVVPVLGSGSTGNYTLTGGTVELNAAADQTLKGGVDYYSLTFSNSGIKTLTSGLPVSSIDGLVTVRDAAILDVQNNEFSGAAGLTMLNTSRFKLSALNTTLPQLTGVNTPYTLTGGTVELYGTSSSQTQSLRGTYGSSSTNVTYNNVELNATGANVTAGGTNVVASAGFNVAGTMNVNSPACFQLGSGFTIAGAGAFNVLSGSTFKYGGTIVATGASGNIQTTTRNFSTTASYGFVGSVNQSPGTGLPTQMVNMYLDKDATLTTVTLPQSVTVNGSLVFYKGLALTGANKITVPAGTVTGAGNSTGWVNGNLEKGVSAGASIARSFEVGGIAANTYSPADVTFASVTNAGTLTGTTVDGAHPNIATSGISTSNRVNRYWTITKDANLAFTNYAAVFNFNSGEILNSANTGAFGVGKYNSPTWTMPTVGSRTSTSTQITGVTSFSDFVVGEIIASYVWTGGAGTHTWGTGTNWLGGVAAPSGTTIDVTVQATGSTNYPTLPSAYTLRSITMNDGSKLDLSNLNLDVKGNWVSGTGTGSSVIGTGALILSGTSAQTLAGKTSFTTLRLNNTNGATMQLNSTVDINTALELQAGTFHTGSGGNNGTLTFKSASTTQAAVLDNFSSGMNGSFDIAGTTGTVIVERAYAATSPNSYNQHFFGSPVNQPALSQFGSTSSVSGAVSPMANCDETQLQSGSLYGSVMSYNQANGGSCSLAGWYVEASTNPAQNAKGYSVAKTGSGTLTLTGKPNLDPGYTVTGLANGGWLHTSLQGRQMRSGWQMVANPYIAELDLNTITPDAGMGNEVQVWNAITGNYVTYVIGNPSNPVIPIAPGQAFFVKKTNTGSGATYTIPGTARKRNVGASFYQQQGSEQLALRVVNQSTGLDDVTRVEFNSNATDQFDEQYDAHKMAGSLSRHTLYSLNQGTWMSFNVLNSIAQTSTVDVGFEPGISGSYTMKFEGINSFDPTSYIILEDKKLNIFYDVRQGDYNYTSDAADDWNRFVLHFTPKAEVTTVDQQCSTLGTINVTQPGTANWTYTLTDNNNTSVSSGTLNEGTPLTASVSTGIYTLTLVDNNNYTVVKTITVNGNQPIAAAFTPSVTSTTVNTDVAFNSSTQGASDYYWDFGDGNTATGQNAIHSYNEPGTYTVTLIVISEAGCSTTSSQTLTVSHTTGIGQVSGTGPVTIWSNNNRVYVDFSKQAKVDAEIEIFNILGQHLVNEKFGRNTIYTQPIENMEAGYVIVKVKNEGHITTKRLFIGK